MASTLGDDVRSAFVREVVSRVLWLGGVVAMTVWTYLKPLPPLALLAAGGALGVAATLMIAPWVRRRSANPPARRVEETSDPRVVFSEQVSVGQEFWLPHGARESYRVAFPVEFAEAPTFERVPWPIPLCEMPQTTGKPDRLGFTLVTADGKSTGDGSGKVKLAYVAKGRLADAPLNRSARP